MKIATYIGQQPSHYHLVQLIGNSGFVEVHLDERFYLGTFAAGKVLTTKLVEGERK